MDPSKIANAAMFEPPTTSNSISVKNVLTKSESVKSSPPSCITNSPILIELSVVKPEVAENDK